nr:tigger transposable element-derived protein 1-like [Procambarus clarkii]
MGARTYKRYTTQFKLRVISYAAKTNNCVAARKYGTSEKAVRDWKKISAQLKEINRNDKGKVPTNWPELEEHVADWVNERLQNGHGIYRASIRPYALKMARKCGITDFMATTEWYSRFMKRHNFVGLKRSYGVRRKSPEMGDFESPEVNDTHYKRNTEATRNFLKRMKRRHCVPCRPLSLARSHQHIRKSKYSIEFKLKICDLLRKGKTQMSIARQFQMNQPTICSIKKQEHILRKALVEGRFASSETPLKVTRLWEIENALYFWIQDQYTKGIPVDDAMICKRATEIHADMEQGDGNCNTFIASDAWLRRFRKRHNLRLKKSTDPTAASSRCATDHTDALSFRAKFAAIINEEGYSPEQVFMVGETVHFWKHLPAKTFLMEEEKAASGFKASNEYMTLLFCSNAAGDFKLPPLLVYRSLCPHELENVFSLPVVWRANSKAWMTSAIFTDWYQHNFIPAVDKYLKSRNLPSKAILFVHSTPSHPQTLKGTVDGDGYRLEFFPPDTSSLLQSLDQGVIAQIKRLYTKQILWDMLLYVEGKGNSRKEVVEFWKKFSIRSAISIITDSWEKITSSSLNEAWENLWPEIMSQFHGFPDKQKEIRSIVEIANSIPGEGFSDLVAKDIVEHLESHRNIMTPENALELTAGEIEGEDVNAEAVLPLQVPSTAMRQIVEYMNSGLKIANGDPNFKRAYEAIHHIRKAFEVYGKTINRCSFSRKVT